MNSIYKTIGIGSLNSSSSGSIMNRIKSMSWVTIAIFIIVFVLIIGAVYYFMRPTKIQTRPKEGMENANKKQAELMLFYVDWCPHCKTAKPEWEEIKAKYDGKTINGHNVIFTEVNCTEETPEIEEMMNKYKIEGYPTIKLLKDGQIVEFDAKPTKDTLDKFLNSVL